ncbi:PREDICTED: vesicle-associated membrane protein 724-like [Ipomoea nil]|uniref:vesicle-associated membrane protein 724-like n=1 Tax=Ipomoea nil TaxID=35883 RepID=UPI000900BBEB|nr:PREDICTED: vesicle-associated membrane protein 724-like [Ipomoea nil]
MVPESFLYSFVARGTVVLAESHTELPGNFRQIALQRLQELPSSADRFTYNYHRHTFTFLIEDGYTYCAVVNESVGTQLSIAFLENVKTDFNKIYGGGGKAADTAALNKEFGPIMKEQMQYIITHADEIEKLQKLRAQVSQVKTVMHDNIIKTLERERNITNLADKADELHDSAQTYKGITNQIHRKMWWQNMKMKLVVIGIMVILAFVIWLSICRGFNCTN